jgi:hypothetical protein
MPDGHDEHHVFARHIVDERRLKFVEKQDGRYSMSLPPAIDDADLIVRLWSGANVEVHRRRRSSSISADAGRDLPASADDQDVGSASCKA